MALAEQGDRLHAQRKRVGRVVTQRIEMQETGVGGGDRGREDQSRLCDLDLGRALLRDGGRQCGAVLAPEVELIGHVEGGGAIAVPALWQGLARNQEVVALLGLGDLGGRRHLGQARGAGTLNLRGCGLEACLGKVEVGRVVQRLLDQRIELRVAVGAPPLIARPGRDGGRERARAAELVDFLHGRGRIEPGDLRAAAGQGKADGEQQGEAAPVSLRDVDS